MGRRRVATLLQLVLPLLVLVLVLECSARAMPRSGGAIVFREDRFGTVWDRIRARTARPVISARTTMIAREEAQGDRQVEQEPMYISQQERHQPQRLGRLELPPASRWSTEQAKPAQRTASQRRRSTSSSSAIIFPGQSGYDLPRFDGKPTERTTVVVTPVVDTPVVDTPVSEFVETLDKTTAGEGTPAKEEGLEMPECDGVAFRALDILSGKCRSLTMRSGCATGEWFVLDRETRLASCRPHPCPIGSAMLAGACHNLSDSTVCALNMVLQVDEFGDAACDCAKGYIYWPAEQRCYLAMMRGPCASGQQLTVAADGPACVKNPCGRDGWARWPETGVCHRLRDVNDAPCAHGRMEVDSASLALVCTDAVPNSVFSTPSVRCAVGSRRAQRGRCKRTIASSSESSLRRGGAFSLCPSGFLETPDGGCRRKSSGGLGGLG